MARARATRARARSKQASVDPYKLLDEAMTVFVARLEEAGAQLPDEPKLREIVDVTHDEMVDRLADPAAEGLS